MIYFDNAATTFPKPEVVYKAMDNFYRSNGVNAGRGSYNKAVKVSYLIEETRKKLALLLNLDKKKEVVFTPSATIAINTVIKGMEWEKGDIVYYSPFEHNATLRSLYHIEKKFEINLVEIPVSRDTLEYRLDELEIMFKKYPPKLLIVSHVSNVTGVIAPVEKIAKHVHQYNGLILVDGAQAAGILKVKQSNIDYYIWAGHKSLYGPLGIAGFTIDKNATNVKPLIHGGTGNASELKDMPNEIPTKYETGSINIQAVAGLKAAIEWIESIGVDAILKKENMIIDMLINTLSDYMNITMFTPEDKTNHFGVIAASFSGYTPHDIGKILNENYDIAVRTGLHCSPKTHEFLGTIPYGLVRFSVSYFNTEHEVKKLKEIIDSFII